jgi:hypothetical protein
MDSVWLLYLFEDALVFRGKQNRLLPTGVYENTSKVYAYKLRRQKRKRKKST